MIGRDLAGCLPLALFALYPILVAAIFPSLQGPGLWVWFALSLLCGAIAVGLLAYARYPLYRQGKFLSVGPKELPPDRLPAYRWAWRLIVLTVCLQVFLLFITKK